MAQKYDITSNVSIGAIKDPRRYAYMIEVNPWAPNTALKAALLFRGAIIAAWGYVETVLIEIAIRSSRMDEYCDISEKFPYNADNRLGYLRRVLKVGGPFSRFRNAGIRFLERYEETAELRHIMAHGLMEVLGDAQFTYFRFPKGGHIQKCSRRFSIDELERIAQEAARLSRLIQRCYYIIDHQKLLPPL